MGGRLYPVRLVDTVRRRTDGAAILASDVITVADVPEDPRCHAWAGLGSMRAKPAYCHNAHPDTRACLAQRSLHEQFLVPPQESL